MRRKFDGFEWEFIDSSSWRAKVIGGWLVLHTNSIAMTDGKKRIVSQSESMCFVADKDHEWLILKPGVELSASKVTIKDSEIPY